jgi:hypothetical protein
LRYPLLTAATGATILFGMMAVVGFGLYVLFSEYMKSLEEYGE